MIRRYGAYLGIGLLVALALAAHLAGWTDLLDPQVVLAKSQALQQLARAHPILAPLAFVAAYLAVAALALPAAALLSLLGGFLFGRWLGTVLVLVSATGGALIVFLLARSAIGEPLRRRAGPLYEKISGNMRENAVGYLLFLRLVPLFPFFLVNLVAALFEIKTRTFVLTTFFGIAPATFIFVNFGREIGAVSNPRDLLSPGIIVALSGLGLLALVPVAYRRWRGEPAGDATKV